ncbi:MAG: hypothetical protein U5K33_09805 [Halofilum sp. (in: g-proteobacteria)]|nr:hypothetical protein [Halofilum sp. (in: g-proteobacteria)]
MPCARITPFRPSACRRYSSSKDGGVKLEVDGVVDVDRVFRRIDGMAMRRQEMAHRGGDSCD